MEWEFLANSIDTHSGMKNIDFWNRVKDRKGKDIAPEKPPIPKAEYLWYLYCDIKAGVEFVTWTTISDYCRLHNQWLNSWESSQLIRIELMRVKNANRYSATGDQD